MSKRINVEKMVRETAEDLKKEFKATFRISKRRVPHIIVTLYPGFHVSICYFSSVDIWKVFYPYPEGENEQTKEVFVSIEDVMVFLRKLEVLGEKDKE